MTMLLEATPTKIDLHHEDIIIVMDDHDHYRNNFRNRLQKSIASTGFRSFTSVPAESIDEVLTYLAYSNIMRLYFIIDIEMGVNRKTEGIRAIKLIKEHDENVFAGAFSAHGGELEDAQEQGANTVRVKGDTEGMGAAINHFKDEILEHRGKILRNIFDEHQKLQHRDPNTQAYSEFLQNAQWREQHSGQHVAILDGKLVEAQKTSRRDFLRLLHEKYPDTPVYYALVGEAKKKRRISGPRRPRGLKG